MTVEVQVGYATFQPRARLLKLIGAELISDDVVAVTELVKNAYDADASWVVIRFTQVTDDGGMIEVTDDGFGIDRENLISGWMEPAGSTKRGTTSKTTLKGRRVLGEKGLGRFAADKLGSRLDLVSRRTGAGAEICARFDWDQFDTDTRLLGDIESRWELRPAREISSNGTTLRITGLRSTWTERMFRRPSTRLARLRPPLLREGSGFSIRIESDTFPEYSGELSNDFLSKAPYSIDATFNGVDSIDLRIAGGKLEQHPWVGAGGLSCGPIRMRLYAFDLETEAIARIGPRMEVRGWLREWSGVSVYRDGFRLWPYGEPHDDWLRLDQRRVNNPMFCLSNNQVVGFVEIGGTANPELKDQTNREGMIHNQAFADLRKLLHHVFEHLESARQHQRHPVLRSSAKVQSAVDLKAAEFSVEGELISIATRVGPEIGKELRRISEVVRARALEQERINDGYSDLAALGQVTAGLSTEFRGTVDVLRAHGEALRLATHNGRGVLDELCAIESTLKDLQGGLALIQSLEPGSLILRRTIELGPELRAFKSRVQSTLSTHEVEAQIVWQGELIRVEMNPQTLHRVLHILLHNSFDALEGTENPRVVIGLRSHPTTAEIVFSDTGPGIAAAVVPHVFEPMFTKKVGSRGMGLTIARALIEKHGGTIAIHTDRRRRGASFQITLPRKRSRAT